MDLPVQKKEIAISVTPEQLSPEDSVVEPLSPVPDAPAPVSESPSPVPDVPIEPSVTEEQSASAILDAEEQELPPVPIASLPSVVSQVVKTRTKRCPKGCVKKSRCKGGSMKGGKRRKSRKSKRRKSRKSRKN